MDARDLTALQKVSVITRSARFRRPPVPPLLLIPRPSPSSFRPDSGLKGNLLETVVSVVVVASERAEEHWRRLEVVSHRVADGVSVQVTAAAPEPMVPLASEAEAVAPPVVKVARSVKSSVAADAAMDPARLRPAARESVLIVLMLITLFQ